MKSIFPPLALILLLSLHSCSKRNEAAETIVFNCSANASEITALEKEIPLFEERTGIRIKLNPFAGDDKLYAMIAADQAPDIFYVNTVVRDKLAAEGHLLDLDEIAAEDPWLERLLPHALRQGRSIDGGWYSMTNWEFTCGVYYNKDLFDAAGMAYPDSAWDWETMERIAAKLTADTNGDGKIDRYGIYIGSHFIECFEQMNHSPMSGNALLLTLPEESRDVFRRYIRLMERNIMPDLRRVQAMGMQAQQMLQGGRIAMLVEAVPHPNLFESLKIRWGVAPLPRFAGKEPRYFRSGSGGLSISARAGNREAAWEALKWIVSEASIYQPNPILRDAGFVEGWIARYPRLAGTGFEEVWRSSERYRGGDPRFFVRFSSWTMTPIMERLQPLLDRLWSRSITLDQLIASIPEINAHVREELDLTLANRTMRPEFQRNLEEQRALLPRE